MNDFDFETSDATAKPAKKSLFAKLGAISTKAKILAASGLVVVLGGGGAFAYSVYQSPDVVVGMAIASVFTEAHPSLEVSLDYQAEAASGSGSMTLMTADAGTSISLQGSANLNGQPVGATLNLLSSKAGDIYANLSDFDSLGYYLVTSGILPESTVTSARSTLTDTWVKVTKEEVGTYTALAGSDTGCSQVNDVEYTKKASSEFTGLLRNNNFIAIKKEHAQENGDRVFEIGLDAAKLQGFITAFRASAYFNDLLACVPTASTTLDQFANIKQSDLDSAWEQSGLAIKVYANGVSHKMSKMTMTVADKATNQSLNITMKPLGDQSSKVVVPAKSISSTELLMALSGVGN